MTTISSLVTILIVHLLLLLHTSKCLQVHMKITTSGRGGGISSAVNVNRVIASKLSTESSLRNTISRKKKSNEHEMDDNDNDEIAYMHKAIVVDTNNTALTLTDFIANRFSIKKPQVRQWLHYNQVYVNDEMQTQYNLLVRTGDFIGIKKPKSSRDGSSSFKNKYQLPLGLSIVYEDDAIIVIDKPFNMITYIESSVSGTSEKDKSLLTQTALHHINSVLGKRSTKGSKAMVVQSMEEEVSGLVIFAKSLKAKDILQSSSDEMGVLYACLCTGKVSPMQGTIKTLIIPESTDRYINGDTYTGGSKNGVTHKIMPTKLPLSSQQTSNNNSSCSENREDIAISNYRTFLSCQTHSLLEFSLETNRKDQIRHQLSLLDHPVVGDYQYNRHLSQYQSTNNCTASNTARALIDSICSFNNDPLHRLGLHRMQLQISHPITGESMCFTTDVPTSFSEFIKRQSSSSNSDSIIDNEFKYKQADKAAGKGIKSDDEDDDDDDVVRVRKVKVVSLADFLDKPSSSTIPTKRPNRRR